MRAAAVLVVFVVVVDVVEKHLVQQEAVLVIGQHVAEARNYRNKLTIFFSDLVGL